MKDEVRLAKRFLESRGYRVVKESFDYDDYSGEQLQDEIRAIETALEELEDKLQSTPYDQRDDALDELDTLKSKLYAIEDVIPQSLEAQLSALQKRALRAEDIEYRGAENPDDEYDRGEIELRRRGY